MATIEAMPTNKINGTAPTSALFRLKVKRGDAAGEGCTGLSFI
jgi:hypothetical protein